LESEDRRERDAVAGSISQADLRPLVLGLLARREMYGYEVASTLAAQLRTSADGPADAIELAQGSVYPALRRLERRGLAAAHWVDVGEGVPRRRYYVLTAAGETVAARAAAGVRRPAPAIAHLRAARP
jgi:DNA-binding PadR family transcriptional regulator